MEETKVKYILNLAGELSERLKGLLQVNGYQIIDSDNGSVDPTTLSYIFVRDYQKPFFELEEKYKTIANDIYIISLSEIENQFEFFACNGRACLPEGLLNATGIDSILNRFFSEEAALQMEYVYRDVLHDYKSLKVTNNLSAGYYTDIVAADAFEKDFNIVLIRSFFVSLISYLFYLRKEGVVELPIDVDYGHSEDSFVIQAHMPVRNFVAEHIIESFARYDSSNSFRYLLRMCSRLCDVFDMYFLKKSSKFVITAVWLQADAPERKDIFPAVLLHDIQSFAKMKLKIEEGSSSPQVALEHAQQEMLDLLEEKNLHGGYAGMVVGGSKIAQEPINLRRIIKFIEIKISQEKIPRDVETLSREDLEALLADFPKENLVKELTADDYDLILKSLIDPRLMDDIDGSIEDILSSVDRNEMALDEYFGAVLDSLPSIDSDDINNLFAGNNLFANDFSVEDESEVRISGVTDSMGDDSSMVSGKYDVSSDSTRVGGKYDVASDDSMRVKGSTTQTAEDVWHVSGDQSEEGHGKVIVRGEGANLSEDIIKVKGRNIAEEIKRRFAAARAAGKGVEDIDISDIDLDGLVPVGYEDEEDIGYLEIEEGGEKKNVLLKKGADGVPELDFGDVDIDGLMPIGFDDDEEEIEYLEIEEGGQKKKKKKLDAKTATLVEEIKRRRAAARAAGKDENDIDISDIDMDGLIPIGYEDEEDIGYLEIEENGEKKNVVLKKGADGLPELDFGDVDLDGLMPIGFGDDEEEEIEYLEVEENGKKKQVKKGAAGLPELDIGDVDMDGLVPAGYDEDEETVEYLEVGEGKKKTEGAGGESFVLEGDEAPGKEAVFKLEDEVPATEQLTGESWKVKSQNIVEQLQKKLKAAGGRPGSLADVEKDIRAVVAEQLGVSEAQAGDFVKGLLNNAAAKMAQEGIDQKIKDAMGDDAGIVEEIRWKKELVKKDEQIKRMKNLIDNMKTEIVAKQKTLDAVKDAQSDRAGKGAGKGYEGQNLEMKDTDNLDFNVMTNEIKKLNKESARKELLLQKMKDLNELLKKSNESRIQKLQERIEELSQAPTGEVDVEKIQELQKDNASLSSTIDVLNTRITTISNNMNRMREERMNLADQATGTVSDARLKHALEGMSNIKVENEKLKGELSKLQEALRNAENGDSEQAHQAIASDMREKDRQIGDLKKEVDTRKYELKETERKVKELSHKNTLKDQRIKHLEKQVDRSKGSSVTSAQDAKYEHKIKQLELINSKLTTASTKGKEDLTKAKQEAIKYKCEVVALKNKLSALQRKVDKKAS